MNKFLTYNLAPNDILTLEELGRLCRGDILKMTTLAGSGHPGGSMSSIDIYLVLYSFANLTPKNFNDIERDRIIISHGHTSPGVYSALGRLKFFPIDEAISFFRKTGSIFEGHVERDVPGIDWTTGNLGQGLSAGVGFALGAKLLNIDSHVFVVMGDGEQQKGQLTEARRFAKKYNIDNITAIIDYNKLQISGNIKNVMPQNIKANYKSDGWDVIEINGHDYKEIFEAIKYSIQKKDPVAIIANTVMGKGVSFMENKEEFHGKALSEEQLDKALKELGLENDLEKYKIIRETQDYAKKYREVKIPEIEIKNIKRKIYPVDILTDNRSAYGNALIELAENNNIKFAVFDCDLAGSVKTSDFSKIRPDEFFQGGIQEHNTATIAGAISTMPILTFFSDFGIFGIDEVYNQQRLNDINFTNLKLVCTHIGLNVGEDGKTHQCIDYIGLLSNLYNFKIIIPADPNQTDEVIKFIAKAKGNFFVGMGRAKTPVITNEEGEIYFNENYKFEYGKMDLVRKGEKVTLISMGPLLIEAIKAWEMLKKESIIVNVVNCSCPTQIDIQFLKSLNSELIISIEDHNINTGLGSKIADAIMQENLNCKLIKLGVTSYGYSGKPNDLYNIYGLDCEGIAKKIKENII